MGELDIGATAIGNLKGTETNYSVDSISTDGVSDQKETEYTNEKWAQQLGYYKSTPELKVSIDAIATWAVGKGFIADELTELKLMSIKGWGKDSFNSILRNQIKVYKIGGDSFAHIIRNQQGVLEKVKSLFRKKDDREIINVKPLDPEHMRTIVNRKGIIKRYEQLGKNKKVSNKFKPDEIFHLSNDRIADEIHGISLVDAVEWIILAKNEAMADMKTLMHRYVKPRIIFKLDTEDDAKIDAFKVKHDKANNDGENMYLPMGAVEFELLAVPTNATLNPLPWINMLNTTFYQVTGVPQIIVGGTQEITEASGKISYLAFEQTIKAEQLYVEEQVLDQLDWEINLEFPASLENELISDNNKDGEIQASTPEDTSVQGVGVNPTEAQA